MTGYGAKEKPRRVEPNDGFLTLKLGFTLTLRAARGRIDVSITAAEFSGLVAEFPSILIIRLPDCLQYFSKAIGSLLAQPVFVNLRLRR